MNLSEARERARALVIQGIDDPELMSMVQEELDELERFIEERSAAWRLDVKTTPGGYRNLSNRNVPHSRKDFEIDDDSWLRLMSAAWLVWRVAMDDHEMRHDPGKPKRLLEANYGDEESFDYGDMAGAGLDDWDAWWAEVYYTRPGRRHPAPSLGPLYEVYLLVREWWLGTGKSSFRLTYNADLEFRHAGVSSDSDDFNAPGRLFLAIAQALDGRYTTSNCATVYDKWRKRGRK